MNSWKEAPHLFVNGTFWYKVKNSKKTGIIVGINGNKTIRTSSNLIYPTSQIELIARPILDMSFMEVKKAPKHKGWDATSRTMIESLEYAVNNDCLHTSDLIYLLDKGVYPLNQSHFETGEVIRK